MGVGVFVGVRVEVGVEVTLLVAVTVEVAVAVKAGVFEAVIVGVGLVVFVTLTVVAVGVFVAGLAEVLITNCGLFPLASRLLKLIAELLLVVNTKSYRPSPVTNELTSTLIYLPEVKLPDVPITTPASGALL